MKYTQKPEVIEAFTFDEFLKYGKQHAETLHDGVPWSFDFFGAVVTHETDEKYIITERQGHAVFTKDKTVVINKENLIVIWENDDFKKFFLPFEK